MTLDFGATKLNTPSVQGVELTNTTADDCIVGDPVIVSGGPAFHWPGGNPPAGRELPPGGRMSVRVELVAQQAIAYSGAMQFYVSNRNAPAMTINLAAQGDILIEVRLVFAVQAIRCQRRGASLSGIASPPHAQRTT